ncbi:hypothetical protein HU200_009193 [Digitaria exilis]|uniref:Uncharacterized protein n=1 Tax=Digitaria exilis TaxID=1010633 RepID=A0A835FJW8_9POAL|nr:hypothetical protein HU200_009193 [Digitaria exilis]CAB3460165.1 unnamed protein product [Digitaria exilis]
MTTLTFAVRRHDPELIGPAAPTPRETKRLSDIDHQGTRMHMPMAFFYRGGHRGSEDPAAVIRRALGEALVPYYPLAGRIRDVAGKLVVDCTGEGVLFVEADADVRLAELEAETGGVKEPLPCMDELLFDVEGSSGFFNCPVMLIQVTRLLCGGFVFALRIDHALCDAAGLAQFISAVAELARGLPSPTIAPAWSRELLDARSPPRPAVPNPAYDPVAVAPTPEPPSGDGGSDMVSRAFTLTRADIAAIKQALPTHLREKATTFEALAAAIWRARVVALDPPAGDDMMRLGFTVSVRRFPELGLPAGYYGNAIVFVMATATAGALRDGTLGDAVELVREAKALVTAEYVRSVANLLVLRRRPSVSPAAARGVLPRRGLPPLADLLIVSDARHAGFHTVDFGWGGPVYGGTVHTHAHQPISAVFSAVKNGDGEDVMVVVPLTLTRPAMDRFASEIEMLVKASRVAPASRSNLLLDMAMLMPRVTSI